MKPFLTTSPTAPGIMDQPSKQAISLFTRSCQALVLLVCINVAHAEPSRAIVSSFPDKIVVGEAGQKTKLDQLIEAIDDDEEDTVLELLGQGVDINGTSSEGWTPLGFAASEGRVAFVKLLLDKGAKVNHPLNSRRTPILAAAEEGQLAAIKLLMSRGATLDVQHDNRTPLALAASEGHLEVVRFLLEQTKDSQVKNEQTKDNPLVLAAAEGHESVVELLLSKGKYDPKSKLTLQAFLSAAGEGHVSVVEKFVNAGTAVDAKLGDGNTALVNAANDGHLAVVEYLLKKGADVNKANTKGKTPLHNATSEGHTKVMERFIAAGANVEAAADGDWTDTNINYSKDITKGTRIIYSRWTPLLFAIEEGHLDAAKTLIDAKANVNVQVQKTRLRIEHKAARNEITVTGTDYVATNWTPLMEAVEKRNIPMIKLLLTSGADKNAQTKEGLSVSSLAKQTGNKEIMALVE